MLVLILGTVWMRLQPAPTLSGVLSFENLSKGHKQGTISYPQTPPVGGDHNPAWQNCGIYEMTISNEMAVHSLEHGAIWIAYRPDLATTEVNVLKNLVQGQPYTLLTPHDGLSSPIVAVAWGKQLTVDRANDDRLSQFLTTYIQ